MNNPGSKEALELGCTCPVWDNYNGGGFIWFGTEGFFYISEDCPLHAGGNKTDADVKEDKERPGT